MFLYQIKTALKSLRRNPILTALLIGGIALGICIATTFVTLRHMYMRDALSQKKDQVFYVRLDSWGQDSSLDQFPGGIPNQITYPDARGLMSSPVPVRQTPTYMTKMFVHPDPGVAEPYQAEVRMVFADFFPMFDVPFQYGGGWPDAADERVEPVVVIDYATNLKLFGGENSVGRSLRLRDRDFQVAGVLAPWRPGLRIFDLTRDPTGAPEPIYIPFNHGEAMTLWAAGNNSGWKRQTINSFEDNIQSERIWLQYWVEIPDAESRGAYNDWLRGYIDDQRALGRFERPTRFAVTTIPALIEEFGLVPNGVKAMSLVSLLFLAVCSLNLVGILLGKFLSRIPEVSVRRALGASKAQIFWQHVIECELIGLIGGAAGIILSIGVLSVLGRFMDNGDALGLDGEMLLVAAVLSLLAGLTAGIYPAWRVCRVAPAMQLKIQ
ncbi:MAG TPA: ABC transporter permease [Thermoanaerobaculia bacterium]